MKVNTKYFGEHYLNNDLDLQTQQLFWGLTLPRYETYIGDHTYYGQDAVYFDDPMGAEIINREDLAVENFKTTTVIELFFKYPLDMLALYMRHLISLMTPAFRQIYITDLYPNKGLFATVSILIWIMAGLGLIHALNKKNITSQTFYMISICIPSLLQMFGAPEIRFFLPVYLLCYVYVFVYIDYKELISYYRGKWIYVLLGSVSIFLLWIVVYGDVLSMNQYIPLIIHDNIVNRGLIPK